MRTSRRGGPALLALAALLLTGTAPALAQGSIAVPVVTVVTASTREIVDRVPVSGTLVPRDEVLVSPELDGLRITDVLVEEGDHVSKDQVLARLSREMLDTQAAQNEAALARDTAAIEQSRSAIDQAEAAADEARQALNRAQILSKSGNATEATLEQRVSASRSSDGRLAAARNGLSIAQADLAQAKAQQAEITLRLARTEIRAPVDGIVSRRTARVGATAGTAGEPLFRLIAHGTIELEGEVTETALSKMRPGAPAEVRADSDTVLKGHVRAVYPEVDRASRLGKVRVALDPSPALHIGGFVRGSVELARRQTVAVPLSALLYGADGATTVLVVQDGRVAERPVQTGLSTGGFTEIRTGVAAGDVVVARAGPFLRTGDAVKAVASADADPQL